MTTIDHLSSSTRRLRVAKTAATILGWLLLLAGLAFLVSDLVDWYMTGDYRTTSVGQAWFDFNVASLNLAQAVIQRYIHPFLWDPIIASVLRWPAWSLLGGIGAFLVLALPLRGAK